MSSVPRTLAESCPQFLPWHRPCAPLPLGNLMWALGCPSNQWVPHHQTPGLLPPACSPAAEPVQAPAAAGETWCLSPHCGHLRCSETAQKGINFYQKGPFSSLLHYAVDLGSMLGYSFYSHLQFVHGFTNTTLKPPSLYKVATSSVDFRLVLPQTP